MKQVWLKITLLDDSVFSQSSVTEGQHSSLDYIPGSVLLGAAAARNYADMDTDTSYRLFHSGMLRFGNALPLQHGHPSLPVPLAWHHGKTQSYQNADKRLDSNAIYNLAAGASLPPGLQPKQMRSGFVTLDGRKVEVAKTYRMKTAIAAESGRAAESQLFGYEAVSAGQTFLAPISADETISDEHFNRIVDSLEGERLLGRSRSAEYGKARVERLNEGPTLPRQQGTTQNTLTLWLLSDLCLQDENGIPTLEPTPELLGLGEGKIRWDRTFLRTRRYAPWNGYRKARDMERNVISQGSVITLEFSGGRPDESALQALASGVGLYREAGLGQLWYDAPLLADAHPEFETTSTPLASTQPKTQEQPPARSALIEWLTVQSQQGLRRGKTHEQAKRLLKTLKAHYANARRLNAVQAQAAIGPSASQWGEVQHQASSGKNAEELQKQLFDKANGTCRVRDNDNSWGAEYYDGQQLTTFSAWLESACGNEEPRLVAELARMARNWLNSDQDTDNPTTNAKEASQS